MSATGAVGRGPPSSRPGALRRAQGRRRGRCGAPSRRRGARRRRCPPSRSGRRRRSGCGRRRTPAGTAGSPARRRAPPRRASVATRRARPAARRWAERPSSRPAWSTPASPRRAGRGQGAATPPFGGAGRGARLQEGPARLQFVAQAAEGLRGEDAVRGQAVRGLPAGPAPARKRRPAARARRRARPR